MSNGNLLRVSSLDTMLRGCVTPQVYRASRSGISTKTKQTSLITIGKWHTEYQITFTIENKAASSCQLFQTGYEYFQIYYLHIYCCRYEKTFTISTDACKYCNLGNFYNEGLDWCPGNHFDQNRDFSKILTKIGIFRKFWPISKFFENFDQKSRWHELI